MMPAPGDQHKPNGVTTANPFEETKHRISNYTAQEIATLQSRLNKRLGPEYISTRPGPGNQKVAYLSADKVINLANEVFGFNGWSSSIQNIQIDFVEENATTGKVSIGLSVVVRVTLKDGTYHEDIGYGGVENSKGKAAAFEKSKKEATTDALKRALRSFGNVLGNCIYDKDFVTKVSKVKTEPSKFEINDLYRHQDFAPRKEEGTKGVGAAQPPRQESSNTSRTDFEDSFDVEDFDDVDFDDNEFGHPDEVVIPSDAAGAALIHVGPGNLTTPSKAPQQRPPAQTNGLKHRSVSEQIVSKNNLRPHPAQLDTAPNHSNALQPPGRDLSLTAGGQDLSSPRLPPQPPAAQQTPLPGQSTGIRPAGFYSARAAEAVDENNISKIPVDAVMFNPHAESPSIRKTAGVDHRKSVPVKRDLQAAVLPKEAIDSKADPSKKVAMPGVNASTVRPGMSTSAYRPPTRYGSPLNTTTTANTGTGGTVGAPDRALTAARRHPLGDVSNMQHTATAITMEGADAKRQKLTTDGGTTNLAPRPERAADT